MGFVKRILHYRRNPCFLNADFFVKCVFFAVIAQQWSARIRMIPRHVPAGIKVALLLKCEVDLMGGGRDFIQVTGWERDGKLIGKLKHTFYGDHYVLFFFF